MTIDNLRQEAEKRIKDRDSKKCVFVCSSQNNDLLKNIQSKLKEEAANIAVLPVGSFGFDSIEPFMVVAKADRPRIVFGNLTTEMAEEILRDFVQKDILREELALGQIGDGKPYQVPDFFSLPFLQLQQRIALHNCGKIDPENIYDYIACGGYEELGKAILNSATELIEHINDSGIKEIGGENQSVGELWRKYHDVQEDDKYVVCNAAKRDIDDNSARMLLESDPHTILEGLMLAGYAVGADKGYVVVNQGSDLAISRLEAALCQMADKGLLGENIFGSGISFDIEISVCGDIVVNREDTAIVSGLSGDREMPFVRRETDGVLRLHGKPICINSAETLAKIPVLLQKGSNWFKKIGTEQSRGTRIVSLHGDSVNCGVAELPYDVTFKDIVYNIGGGVANKNKFKAALIGGATGGFLPEKDLGLNLSHEDMRKFGIKNESGVICVLNNERCMVWETKEVMFYAAA